ETGETAIDFYTNVLGFVPIRRPGSFDFDGAWLFNYVEKKLKEMGITYKRQRVEEGGIYVDQLFFHDPDGFMIEICNCDNLPVIPLAGEMVPPVEPVSVEETGKLNRVSYFEIWLDPSGLE
nr:hypothetical protein [Tanacetum cinerariifolium]